MGLGPHGRVAQLAERAPEKREVTGSTPAPATNNDRGSGVGRLLGFGEFILESAGQDQALTNVDYLPYPEQLYLEVCGLIFKDKGDSDD